jgi:hypothetical protein
MLEHCKTPRSVGKVAEVEGIEPLPFLAAHHASGCCCELGGACARLLACWREFRVSVCVLLCGKKGD